MTEICARPVRQELEPDEHMSDVEDGEGMLLVGDRGKIQCGFEGQNARLIPASRMKAFRPPPDDLPKSPGAYQEWLGAIRGGAPPRANFEFEQKVVEAVLLGSIAVRMGTRLEWDAANERIIRLAESRAGDLENGQCPNQSSPPLTLGVGISHHLVAASLPRHIARWRGEPAATRAKVAGGAI